jgi:hypothetical protein
MLKMVDSAAVYVMGRQPGSRIHHNFISEQGQQRTNAFSHLQSQRLALTILNL